MAGTTTTSPRLTRRSTAVDTTVVALGVLLIVEVLRGWLPSVITIFGDAGGTPVEQLGAFALVWFVLAFGAVPLVKVAGADRVALLSALILVLSKVSAGFVNGGTAQLALLCIALLAGLIWLVATAAQTRSAHQAAVGVTAGLGSAVALHAALGTLDALWRTDAAAIIVHSALACAFVVATAVAGTPPPDTEDTTGARGAIWVLTGPAILLTGVVTGATSRAEATPGWTPGVAMLVVVAGALLAIPVAGQPSLLRRPVVPAVVLLLAILGAAGVGIRVDGIAGVSPSWAVICQAIGALALGSCLGWVGIGSDARGSNGDLSSRRGLAAATGMLLFALGIFAYYAAYDADLGVPNLIWLVVAAIAIGITATRVGQYARRWPADPARTRFRAACAVAGIVVVVFAQLVSAPVRPAETLPVSGYPIRLVAYNIRMGFGINGRFDPDALAATIASQKPDVVALSEVDRGWFVNGGHDDLRLLADRLGMRAIFAPAADAVWGDAVLTRLPVVSVRSEPLPKGGPTGAQALSVVVKVGQSELGIVATHLQAPESSGQARRLAELAGRLAAGGRPVVIAGDLNITPSSADFSTLTAAGFVDGLADERPEPTFPADNPREEIDHVLTTANLAVSNVVVPASVASDHRPVAVTLTKVEPEQIRPID